MNNPENRPDLTPEKPNEIAAETLGGSDKTNPPGDSPDTATEMLPDLAGAADSGISPSAENWQDEEPVKPAAPEEGKIPIYRDFNLLQLAVIIFLVDQLTKFLVRAYLPFGYSFPFDGFFRITHTHNTGSAFGILQGQNTPLIFVSFIGIFVLVMIYRSQPHPTNLLRFSLALQIGGALGNLLDRLRLGSVTDFIDVGAWPVFNLADASIVSGLCLLGWLLLRPGRKDEAPDLAAVVAEPSAVAVAPENLAAEITPAAMNVTGESADTLPSYGEPDIALNPSGEAEEDASGSSDRRPELPRPEGLG
jgi:signal peptidase II